MFKCEVCGNVMHDGTKECPNCRVYQEPPVKFAPGQLVKLKLENRGVYYINTVVDSYFNHDIKMHMYRLSERMAMPIYREDWLEPVSSEEVDKFSTSGKLVVLKRGGLEHPIECEEAAHGN